MSILLVYKCHDLGKMEFYSRFTPLGLGSIVAVLRQEGHDARLVNASAWSWSGVARHIETERPDLLGVSVFTFNRHEAIRLARLAHGANPRCRSVPVRVRDHQPGLPGRLYFLLLAGILGTSPALPLGREHDRRDPRPAGTPRRRLRFGA